MLLLSDLSEAVVGFEELLVNVTEGDRTVQLCVVVFQPSSVPLLFNFNLEATTDQDTACMLDFSIIDTCVCTVWAQHWTCSNFAMCIVLFCGFV